MDTLWGFCSVVVCCGTVLYLARQIMPVVLAQQSTPPRAESPTPLPPKPEPIPMDLLKLVEMESEGWARESALKKLMELYEDTGDWNIVRGVYRPYPDAPDFS